MSRARHDRHVAKTSAIGAFTTCVNPDDCNPAAHGNVVHRQVCACGAVRLLAKNQDYGEPSPWTFPEEGLDPWGEAVEDDLAVLVERSLRNVVRDFRSFTGGQIPAELSARIRDLAATIAALPSSPEVAAGEEDEPEA